MAVEPFGFLNSLNPSNPASSDGLVGGDDHIRGIKKTLKDTFPNITDAITATATQINQLASGLYGFAAGTSGAPSAYFVDATLGFYKSAAGILTFVGGRLTGNGTVPVGAVVDFFVEPEGLGTEWLEVDGSTHNNSTFPRLAAHLNQGGSTFTLKNAKAAGRYRRSRTASLAAGTLQDDAIKTHTASVSVSGANHAHANSLSQNPHDHAIGGNVVTGTASWQGSGIAQVASAFSAADVQPAYADISINNVASGTLSMTGTASYTGETETRPTSLVVITCIKT